MELWLARHHHCGLSRRRILRKHCLAWRLLWLRRRRRTTAPAITRPLGLSPWRHGLERLRHRKRRSSVQPEDRSVRRDCARVQCLWELWSLDGFEKRYHRLRAASNELSRNHGSGAHSNGASAYGASGKYGIAPPWAKPQMATSTRPRTGTPTRTRERLERKARNQSQHQSAVPAAGEGRKRAADHRHSVEAAEAVGHPDRPVLAVRQAGQAAAADKCKRAQLHENESWLSDGFTVEMFGGFVCRVQPAESQLPSRLILLALIILFAGCSKPRRPAFKVFASPDDAGNWLLDAAKSGDQNAVSRFSVRIERYYFLWRSRAG